jgi:5,10-methylenetetrahydrofolate reductase
MINNHGDFMLLSIENFKNTPKISLEFTSPSDPATEKNIMNALEHLRQFDTDFSCVNFGGNFISPKRALMITNKLKNHYKMPVIGYLRRSNIARDEFDSITDDYLSANITKIFLTEGRRLNTTAMTTNHHTSLLDAVMALKKKNVFKIAIEARPDCDSSEIEIITRFSFNTQNTIRFIDKLGAKATLPKIRIGIIPIESPSQTFLTAHLLNVPIPDSLHRIFEHYTDNHSVNLCLGTHILLSQIHNFMQAGYDNFHIRFGRSFEPIEALCRFYGIEYTQPKIQTETIKSFEATAANEHTKPFYISYEN